MTVKKKFENKCAASAMMWKINRAGFNASVRGSYCYIIGLSVCADALTIFDGWIKV